MSLETKRLYEFGPYRIDAKKRLLQRDGEVVQLTPKPFDLLVLLVESGGQVLSKEYLIKHLWPDSFVEEGNLTVAISMLRKALGESPGQHRYIVTVPGRGYKFVADVRSLWNETASLIVEERTASHIVVEHEEAEPRTGGTALTRVGLGVKARTLGIMAIMALLIIPAIIVAALIWRSSNRQLTQTDARSLSALNFIPLTNWKSEPGDNPNTSAATFSRSDRWENNCFLV